MGIITKIELQKNKNRVNIFIDDSFFCGLEKETAISFGFKQGKIVDENTILEAIESSEVKRAFEKIMSYVLTRMYSKKELEEKLQKKGFDEQVISRAILKGIEYGYINDEQYTKVYIENNKKYSKNVLKSKLFNKGISKDIIDENLKGLICENDEIEICKKYAERYLKSKSVSNNVEKQKLIASLARRGFSFDVIKKSIENIIEYDPDIYY